MGTGNYSGEFKRDEVHQITVRGYPVQDTSKRHCRRWDVFAFF